LLYADEKKRQDVPYMKFVDYKTGKIYPNKNFINTEEFWKPLSEVIRDYVEHKESKSDGDIGELKRKIFLKLYELDITIMLRYRQGVVI